MTPMKLLKEVYKTYEGARKRAASENALAPGEYKRGDKAHLYYYSVIADGRTEPSTWRVQREKK